MIKIIDEDEIMIRQLLRPGMEILDVGCGDGKYTKIFAEFGTVDAIDVIDEIADKTDINFIQANLRYFNTNKKYDFICARNVFFITKNPIGHAKRYVKFLNPGGIFFLTLLGSQDPWILSPMPQYPRWAVTIEQVQEFMEPFDKIFFCEEKARWPQLNGEFKEWHIYHLILRKR